MTEHMATVTRELLDTWALEEGGPVAVRLTQRLMPIETTPDGHGIVFPPTYADIGYNIDQLSDGTYTATIDSVASQANRLEPLFKKGQPLEGFVPEPRIEINDGVTVSILDLAHRAADATVQATPTLAETVTAAFKELQRGNATPMCAIAPTSLVFGVWDSRGETGEKRPRLIRSTIRAWDVEVLHTAAQFNSVWKKLDAEQREQLEAEAKRRRVKLADKGFKDAPATFRKISGDKIPQFVDGTPNPDARVLGGVLVKGPIERQVIVNLVALRGLRGAGDTETPHVRRYLLGLTLLAASADMALFLREGALLRYAEDTNDMWHVVPRRGAVRNVDFSQGSELLRSYTKDALAHFKPLWPNELRHKFDLAAARRLLSKKGADEEEAGA